MPSFDLLPAELQIHVFSYLDNSDLKAARAVSKTCRKNASALLFQSAVVCVRYRALGAFQNISLDPIFQRSVRQIIFDASVYQEQLAENEHANYQEQDASPNGNYWKRQMCVASIRITITTNVNVDGKSTRHSIETRKI
jgi:hypothetical protein